MEYDIWALLPRVRMFRSLHLIRCSPGKVLAIMNNVPARDVLPATGVCVRVKSESHPAKQHPADGVHPCSKILERPW